jgi:hypothetical protein
MPRFAACDFSAPGALLAGVDSWLPSSELTPPEMPLSPDTLPPGDGPSVFCVPGSAGKSSELIVNSLASAVGCFTIPTKINRSDKDHYVKCNSYCASHQYFLYGIFLRLLKYRGA